MKTIFRLFVIVSVIALIGFGFYFLFQNPTIQNGLGSDGRLGRGGFPAEENSSLLPNEGNGPPWRGEGQGRGFGTGRGEGYGFGRGEGWGEGRGDRLSSPIGWLELLGTLFRLAILMAIVIALVKIGRWVGRKIQPNRKIETENANL